MILKLQHHKITWKLGKLEILRALPAESGPEGGVKESAFEYPTGSFQLILPLGVLVPGEPH